MPAARLPARPPACLPAWLPAHLALARSSSLPALPRPCSLRCPSCPLLCSTVDAHARVRQEIVQQTRHPRWYFRDALHETIPGLALDAAEMDGLDVDDEEMDGLDIDYAEVAASFKLYLVNIAKPGEYAGRAELKAAAYLYGATITCICVSLHDKTGKPQCHVACFKPRPRAWLQQNGNFALVHYGNHFDGAVLKSKRQRRRQQHRQQQQQQLPRCAALASRRLDWGQGLAGALACSASLNPNHQAQPPKRLLPVTFYACAAPLRLTSLNASWQGSSAPLRPRLFALRSAKRRRGRRQHSRRQLRRRHHSRRQHSGRQHSGRQRSRWWASPGRERRRAKEARAVWEADSLALGLEWRQRMASSGSGASSSDEEVLEAGSKPSTQRWGSAKICLPMHAALHGMRFCTTTYGCALVCLVCRKRSLPRRHRGGTEGDGGASGNKRLVALPPPPSCCCRRCCWRRYCSSALLPPPMSHCCHHLCLVPSCSSPASSSPAVSSPAA